MEAELAVADHLDERQFALEIKRLADSLSFGTDASPFLGSGIEYVQSRLYQPGDPIKAIDWRLTEQTTVGRKLRHLAGVLESRALVIVLSDLHDPQAVPSLKLLAQEHDCVALQLQDPAERGRLGGGVFRAEEAETGSAFVATGRNRWVDQG